MKPEALQIAEAHMRLRMAAQRLKALRHRSKRPPEQLRNFWTEVWRDREFLRKVTGRWPK